MYVDDAIHIEKNDQCYSCEYFMKSVMCPLLEALALGVVELTGDMTVQNCSFYKQHSRHLRVVENATAEENEPSITSDDDYQPPQSKVN